MNKTNEYIKEFDEIIRSVTAAAGRGINSGYMIVDRGMPHTPATLKRGTMGIYTFLYNDEFLKIGKAGPNSNARFSNQHYLPRSSQSNLSKSILKDPAMRDLGITEENSLILTLVDTDISVAEDIARDLCVFFNQESVLITNSEVGSVYIQEKIQWDETSEDQ